MARFRVALAFRISKWKSHLKPNLYIFMSATRRFCLKTHILAVTFVCIYAGSRLNAFWNPLDMLYQSMIFWTLVRCGAEEHLDAVDILELEAIGFLPKLGMGNV